MGLAHKPVMCGEVIALIGLKPGHVAVDATLGGAGHAAAMAERLSPGGRLIGIDADEAAVKRAADTLKGCNCSLMLVQENFRNIGKILAAEHIKGIDAALFDLGVSSYQLDDGQRGFSTKHDAPLDMRMDRSISTTAFDIVNRLKEDELSGLIERYGEERFHRRIARRIAEARAQIPIETTNQLADIVRRAVGAGGRRYKIDPATRTFQAIRIAVNDELAAIEEGVKEAVSWLNPGGRIAVIAFHSLEDRIIKNLFKGYAALGVLKILTKKPLRPGTEEVTDNPRARSARLRVAERM